SCLSVKQRVHSIASSRERPALGAVDSLATLANIISVMSTQRPTYEEIMGRPQMEALMRVLWDGVEVATAQTRDWFAGLSPSPAFPDREGRPIEPYQAASQVRCLLSMHLLDRQWQAEHEEQPVDDPLPDYGKEPLPNNGL